MSIGLLVVGIACLVIGGYSFTRRGQVVARLAARPNAGRVQTPMAMPPVSDATRADRLRWIRNFYRLSLAALMLVVVLALALGGTFLWVVAAVGAVIWAAGLASISMAIRKARTDDS